MSVPHVSILMLNLYSSFCLEPLVPIPNPHGCQRIPLVPPPRDLLLPVARIEIQAAANPRSISQKGCVPVRNRLALKSAVRVRPACGPWDTRLMGTILVGSASIICDRLPKLDTISFRIADPAKLSEVIALAFGIDGDTFLYQTVQHTIQVVHLEIDHCSLCRREVGIVLFEKGEDDLSVLRRGRKRECSLGLHQTEMLLVPLIQSFWIIRSQKYTAKASD